MKCKDCEYCQDSGSGISAGYYCEHENIRASARRYESDKNIRISKYVIFIGYKMPRTCLRWCPLKEG